MALVQVPNFGASWNQITSGSFPATTALNLTGLGAYTYNKYLLLVYGISTLTNNDTANIRFNADSGSNYASFTITTGPTGTSTPTGTQTGTSAASMTVDATAITAGASILIEGAASNGYKFFTGNRYTSQSANSANGMFQGIWKNTATLTSIDVTTATNAFDAGSYVLFGSN